MRPNPSSRGPGGAGFTLPELIIVIVMLGVLGVVGSLMIRSVNEKSHLAVASANALSDLRYAQETAMAERRDVQFIVNTGANSYSAVYAATGAPLKSPMKQDVGMTVVLGTDETSGVSITEGLASVIFNPDGVPYTSYPAGLDLAAPVTVMTLNSKNSVVLQPSGFSEIQ
jgi:prepilin-type N-terminal cleavage/methylation domain-containing protein